MAVRAKFTCVSKKEIAKDLIHCQLNIAEGYVVEMFPVQGKSAENEEFFKYTPYGKIEFSTVSKVAAEQFRVGKDYYIDFTEAGAV